MTEMSAEQSNVQECMEAFTMSLKCSVHQTLTLMPGQCTRALYVRFLSPLGRVAATRARYSLHSKGQWLPGGPLTACSSTASRRWPQLSNPAKDKAGKLAIEKLLKQAH